jgi:hypothetical protein
MSTHSLPVDSTRHSSPTRLDTALRLDSTQLSSNPVLPHTAFLEGSATTRRILAVTKCLFDS